VLRDVPTRHELGDDPEFMRIDRSDVSGVGGRLINISETGRVKLGSSSDFLLTFY
jgi:hypothetical protein